MRRADDADGVRRIRGDEDDVGVRRLHRAHRRRKVRGRRRIVLVVDDLEAVFGGVLARAVGGGGGELGVGGEDRQGLRLWLLRGGELEEAPEKAFTPSGPIGIIEK